MADAALGNTVVFNFTGRLAGGPEFETSIGKEPLKVQLGKGELMPALENAMVGMAVGAKKTIDLTADEAFGQRHDELVHMVPRTELPEDVELEVGQMLAATSPNGEEIQVIIVAMNDEAVTLDGNHPLAGHDLSFDIEMLEIDAAD